MILRGGGGEKKEGAKIGDETGLYLEINNAAPGPSSSVFIKDGGG